MRLVTTLVLLLAASASAQMLEVSGGQSTLMGGYGAGVKTYLPNQTLYLGAGEAAGHFVLGVSDSVQWRGLNITAGDQPFGGTLDATGLTIRARGVSVGQSGPKQTVTGFVGSTGLGTDLGFFAGQHMQFLGAGFFFQRRLRAWKLSTLEISDHGKHTAIAGAGYTGHGLQASAAGGLLQDSRFATGQADYSPLHALHFLASRSNYYFQNQQATANAVGTFALLGPFTAQAQAIRSTSAGRTVSGLLAGAGVHLGPLQVSGTWYESRHVPIISTTVSENSRHWQFSQAISRAAGHTSFQAGGGLHFNRFAVSLSHSIAFFPFGGMGFMQVTAISLSFRIHDTTISGTTTLLPTGPKYSASGDSFVNGPLHFAASPAVHHGAKPAAKGRYIVRGRVLDSHGQPVAGAAVALDGRVVYTDDSGRFLTRFKKAKPVAVAVRPAEFAQPGVWRVVSAPAQAVPDAETKIIIQREET